MLSSALEPAQASSVSGRHVYCAGFGYDRNFVVVRESDAKFITQRQEPKLAQVEVAITEEALRGQPLPQDAALTLSAPGHGAVQVSSQLVMQLNAMHAGQVHGERAVTRAPH